jgi:hypothetical protein
MGDGLSLQTLKGNTSDLGREQEVRVSVSLAGGAGAQSDHCITRHRNPHKAIVLYRSILLSEFARPRSHGCLLWVTGRNAHMEQIGPLFLRQPNSYCIRVEVRSRANSANHKSMKSVASPHPMLRSQARLGLNSTNFSAA